MADSSPLTKWIKFADVGVGEGTLDQYLLGRQAPGGVLGSRVGKFRPIGTSDNEVCMFPATASIKLCTAVASMFSKSLATYTFDATPLIDPIMLNRNVREGPEEVEETTVVVPILDLIGRKSSIAREPVQGRKRSFSVRQDLLLTADSNTRVAFNDAKMTRSASSPRAQRRSIVKKQNDKLPPF